VVNVAVNVVQNPKRVRAMAHCLPICRAVWCQRLSYVDAAAQSHFVTTLRRDPMITGPHRAVFISHEVDDLPRPPRGRLRRWQDAMICCS